MLCLIDFDMRTKVLTRTNYPDDQLREVQAESFRREMQYLNAGDHKVFYLQAQTEAAMRSTHGRWFGD